MGIESMPIDGVNRGSRRGFTWRSIENRGQLQLPRRRIFMGLLWAPLAHGPHKLKISLGISGAYQGLLP